MNFKFLTAICVFFLGAFLWVGPAQADDNRPLMVTIAAQEQGESGADWRVTWKIPANIDLRHVPELSVPQTCEVTGDRRNWSDIMGHWREEIWRCLEGVSAIPVQIQYPDANPNLATIIRFSPSAGAETQTILLQPETRVFTIAAAGEERGSFLDFLALGFAHIWAGIDHLLFVAGLIFIARTPRRVLATITGFTIAHSITLALSALDIVRLPIAAIEAVIALSIVFLAVEIVKGAKNGGARDTLTWRRPIVVASAFGLLHGFGFAAVLQEVGLPHDGFISALLAFNLGIETGQVLFALLVLSVIAALRWAGKRFGMKNSANFSLAKFAGYGVGILASYWMFERMLG